MKAKEMLELEIKSLDSFHKEFADLHRWVLDNGQEFTGFDMDESKKLAKYQKVELGGCYNNTLLVRDYRDDSLLYYEGWCDFGIGFPQHHAWNVRKGVVMDVTLTLPLFRADKKNIAKNVSYYGIMIPYDWAWEQVEKDGIGRRAGGGGPFMLDYAREMTKA
tara:strand:- start:4198 stop:4683 length:486 start_codon:yes stop_codon:yes gene_type:complete